ncbi:hypothetical protein Z043_122566, partial [Scleropages formosus]
MGEPNVHICRARQTMYGLSFTLCVSCILVKALHTFVNSSSFDRNLKPIAIIVVFTTVQVLICTFWLVFDSPRVETIPLDQNMIIWLQCNEGQGVGFGIMLSYIGLLAFICIWVAFKGRKVPHRFNETGYLIFSMVIYLLCRSPEDAMVFQVFFSVLGMCSLLVLGTCEVCQSTCGAQAPGDILLGVLSSCYPVVQPLNEWIQPESFNCTDFNLLSFVRMLAVTHTIDMINDSGFLPGVRLGYLICDTCSNPIKALQVAEHLLSTNGTLEVQCDHTERTPVKAVIGSRYSELSITVARLLGRFMVPQISTSASADILSDKVRFPSFLRTIPGDVHQTRAIAKFMSSFRWDWVGVVYGDDDYGKSALQSFLLDAREAKVCVAYQKVMPTYLNNENTNPRIKEVAKTIHSSTAQVVLLILNEQVVRKIFEEMMKTNTSRIWIASDAWSLAQSLASMPGINRVGEIFGFSFITGQNPGFSEFLQNLQPGPGALLQEMKKIKFSLDNRLFSFDQFGNFANGYDLINWKRLGDRRQFTVVDMQNCLICPKDMWSLKGSVQCSLRTETFFGWNEPYAIVLLTFVGLGLLLLLIVFVVFMASRHSPVVKVAAILVSSYGIIFCHFLPKCYMILCKKKKDISPEAYREKIRIFAITSGNQALCHLSKDSGIGDMETVATASSMNIEVSTSDTPSDKRQHLDEKDRQTVTPAALRRSVDTMPSPLRVSAPALCFLLASVHCQDACQPTCGAQAPGDILIGVIGQCHGESFVETLAVIHTIDVINDSGFLPGVRLGYLICDDCSYPIKALQIAEHLVSTNDTLHVECNPFTSPLVKAVIGARFSEVSITVARFLGLYMVPEISTSSSADTLDDKLRFPSFLRTIPNDEHQTRGIAKFMSSFSWDWVGVVYGDDDYGKSALENFLLNAEDTKVCVAYQEVMPQYLNNGNTDLRVKEVAETIRSYKAQVVLLILKEELVMKIFEEMIKTNTSRIWIASDAWSLAQSLANMPGINMVGEIFGFSFITGQNPGFSEFLQNLQPDPGVVNHFIEEYKNLSCLQCPDGTWSLKGWNQCYPRTETFFGWNEPYAIILLTFVGLGFLLLLMVFVVFMASRHSPVVNVAGGKLCYIMMAALVVSFGSVVLFMGKPCVHICRARQTMYGLGFTLCVSCILVKAFRTFLAFLFNFNRQYKLKKLYKPFSIIVLFTTVQVLICTFWLVFDSPRVETITSNQSMSIFFQCNEGYGIIFCHFLPKCYMILCKKKKDISPEAYREKVRIFSITSANQALCHLSTDSGIGDMKTMATTSSMKVEVSSVEDTMLYRLCAFVPALCLVLRLGDFQDVCQSTCGAQAPGDILIGVISQCHGEVESLSNRIKPDCFNCTEQLGARASFTWGRDESRMHYKKKASWGRQRDALANSFVQASAVIYTIDVINDSGFLPGVRLGYIVCDDCSYPIKALQVLQYLLSDPLNTECSNSSNPLVKAVVGARFSEVSITVARFLGLYMVPEISTSSSADILDDKLRFPSFLRIIPSDVYQTQAIAKFMSFFDWDWVGVVYGDDDYGRSALQSFLMDAGKAKVCVAYQEVVPHYLNNANTDQRIKEVAETIRSSTAQVVLVILKEELVRQLFEEIIRTNSSRIWIASDAWSLAQPLTRIPGINNVGEIFGFSFAIGQNPGFSEFLQNLQPGPGAVNHFIEEYKNLSFGSVVLFMGEPNVHICRARQTMYGLSFTLCVSCILVKALHTFVNSSSFDRNLKPIAIIVVFTTVQVLICTFWLVFDSPRVETIPLDQNMIIWLQCNEGQGVGFGIMLSYIGLLAFICIWVAFKGR